jgi:hypothetical protein
MTEFTTATHEYWKLYYCRQCKITTWVDVVQVGLSPNCLRCGHYLNAWQHGEVISGLGSLQSAPPGGVGSGSETVGS